MRVCVIGGGVAGIQAALALKQLGLTPIVIEKEEVVGGKLRQWHKLFPSMTPVGDVLEPMITELETVGIE